MKVRWLVLGATAFGPPPVLRVAVEGRGVVSLHDDDGCASGFADLAAPLTFFDGGVMPTTEAHSRNSAHGPFSESPGAGFSGSTRYCAPEIESR